MRAVDWLCSTQTPPVIKDLPASVVLASEQPKTVLTLDRFHGSSARRDSSTFGTGARLTGL
jgi:hypothetical protein